MFTTRIIEIKCGKKKNAGNFASYGKIRDPKLNSLLLFP
jgi:hypothetical protein